MRADGTVFNPSGPNKDGEARSDARLGAAQNKVAVIRVIRIKLIKKCEGDGGGLEIM